MNRYRRHMGPGDVALTIVTLCALALAVAFLSFFLVACDSDAAADDGGFDECPECEPVPDPDEVFHAHCVAEVEARCQLIWETECEEFHGFDLPVVCMPDRMLNGSWLGEWCDWMSQCGFELGYLYLGCAMHFPHPEHFPALGRCLIDRMDDGTEHIGVTPYEYCYNDYHHAIKSCL